MFNRFKFAIENLGGARFWTIHPRLCFPVTFSLRHNLFHLYTHERAPALADLRIGRSVYPGRPLSMRSRFLPEMRPRREGAKI
ncbi:hypothetical protein C8J31_10427 [Rhizobium sp. PP-CC-2G-626]|nr:hypothetical protein C8J31_10427 [Rhizobium sp. PP-CC-2G-626]